MAKQMTDEQKLFFGTKSQRAAMKKKHPSWAKDRSGFRQTIKGKRNPFKKACKVAKKVARKVKKITLATINAKIRKGLKLNAADSAWVRKHQPTDAYLAYTTPVKPGAPDYTQPITGVRGGGSSNWLTGDQLVAQKDRQLLESASKALAAKVIGDVPVQVLSQVIPGLGSFKLSPELRSRVVVAGIPGDVFSPPVERPDDTAIYEMIRQSNIAYQEEHPEADIYGFYDPQYFLG